MGHFSVYWTSQLLLSESVRSNQRPLLARRQDAWSYNLLCFLIGSVVHCTVERLQVHTLYLSILAGGLLFGLLKMNSNDYIGDDLESRSGQVITPKEVRASR